MPAKSHNIIETLDQVIAEVDAQSTNRLKYDVPTQWHSTYYLRSGFLIHRSTTASRAKHYCGSDDLSKKCPTCLQQLRLLLDIDCSDARFKRENTPVFNGLKRLPLYYCFTCSGQVTYRVTRNRVSFLRDECTQDESPFDIAEDRHSNRERVGLQRIPNEIEDLLVISQEYTDNWLTAEQKSRIRKALATLDYNLPRSQFGGLPRLAQGHRNYACKNPKCKTHRMGQPWISQGSRYKMKELATIAHDIHGFDSGQFTTIVFHICWYCHTVTSEYECT